MNRKTLYRINLFLVLALVMPLNSQAAHPGVCTYNTYKWNTRLKKVVEFHRVKKPYSELNATEIDRQTGCSVCEQDQQTVNLPGLPAFRVCHRFADDVATTLKRLIVAGFPIRTVVAYRPGMTRGDIDDKGNRTRFSNHSFGEAVDINSGLNGLYDHCLRFAPTCRLIRGGAWHPGVPGTLTAAGPVVQAMKKLGFHWGGKIRGWQKDFMHFSPTGY